MKTTLILVGALMLIGWTTLAAGVLAAFAGDPSVSSQAHHHIERRYEEHIPGPLLSDELQNECPNGMSTDASVPCSA